MRRFWAHIILGVTTLVLVCASFFNVFTSVKTNQEYTEGYEVVYKISDVDDPDIEIPEGEATKIAEKMESRLITTGVTAYSIKTVGNDMIKVDFAEQNSTAKYNTINYLSFNGSLGLSNMDDDENYAHIAGDEFLLSGKKTYLDNINSYPTVVIPVNVNSPSYKDLVEKTNKQKEAGVGETTETEEKDEEGNAKTVTTTYLYLWYDFNPETDSYSRTVEGNANYDAKIARKIIMKFDIENLYYPDDNNDKLSATLKLDSDGDEKITTKEVRDAYDNARFYVNLLNCDSYDYDVTYVNDSNVQFIPATTENIVNRGDPALTVAWSRTFAATLVAIVIIALILTVFFRLSAFSIGVCSLLSTFSAIGFMVAIGAEFNIASIIGVICVAVISLAGGIIYATKMKEEAYRGRTLKKANSEACKKSLLPMVDITVVLVVIGIFMYVFGGSLMRSFALISVVGGLVSLLINLLGLKGMMWLATNSTGLIGRYDVFGIDPQHVHDPNDETKVDYEGDFMDKDFTKAKKPIAIVSLVLMVASLAGLITFGVLNNGRAFGYSKPADTQEVYVETTNEVTTSEVVKSNIFDKILVFSNKEDTTGTTLSSHINKETEYVYTDTVDNVEVKTYYFVYSLDTIYGDSTEALFNIPGGVRMNLSDVLSIYIDEYDTEATAEIKTNTYYSQSFAYYEGIISGLGVAIATIGLYLLLRYRLSRGIVSIIAPIFAAGITAGFFVLIRAALPTNFAVFMPLIVLFTFIIGIMFTNRERELVIEDRLRDHSVENRNAIMKKATSQAFAPIAILTILFIFIGIDFFGFGPTGTSTIFLAVAVGGIIATVLVVGLFGPASQFFYKALFKAENRPEKEKKNKKKAKKADKHSNEPEEAIFIGIND